MRLSYRGLPYDCEPPSVDMAETQLTGRYRGKAFNFAYPRHIPVTQPSLDLQYRGISYRTTTMGRIETPSPTGQVTSPATNNSATNNNNEGIPSTPAQIHPLRMRKQVLMQEITKIHRENLQRRLIHRIEVARARGDERLVAQLENEMHQMA